MAYIPTVHHTPSMPPSPRTRELAGLLTKVLEEYKKSHPGTSDAEIRAAVRLAQLSSRSGNQALPAILSVSGSVLSKCIHETVPRRNIKLVTCWG